MSFHRRWQRSAVLGAVEALRYASSRCAGALRAASTAPARRRWSAITYDRAAVCRSGYAGQSRISLNRGGLCGNGIRMFEQHRKIIAMSALTS